MVYRVYVEKKPGFDGKTASLMKELSEVLGVKGLTGIRLLNRYDVEGISEDLFHRGLCLPSGPMVSDADVDRIIDTINAAIK